MGTTQGDYFYGQIPCTRSMTPEEIKDAYEKNTGLVIIEEFKRRGIDVSSVSHGDSISFAHHVQLTGNRLVIID